MIKYFGKNNNNNKNAPSIRLIGNVKNRDPFT